MYEHNVFVHTQSKALNTIYAPKNLRSVTMLVYVYMCFLLYILSTSFVLTPFLRGLHSMPAGTDVQGSGPQPRT